MISLNILLSYPVRWTKYQVLRDLIQNFYDASGCENFGDEFKYKFEHTGENESNGKLTFTSNERTFSYEWLLHMGASTKQDVRGKYAGYYGEGFKVAVLSGYRDYQWDISIKSQNWSIKVTSEILIIDSIEREALSYELTERAYENNTILEINNFDKSDFDKVDAALWTFFYPQNPLLGKLVYENRHVAIYERSNVQKPIDYPSSYDCNGDGVVFTAYQARGSFFRPIVICDHSYTIDDRERKGIYESTIIDVCLHMVDSLPAAAAIYLLEQMNKYWYQYPQKRYDVHSWYSFVKKLIRRSRNDLVLVEEFKTKFPKLIVLDKPTSINQQNRKTQALVWKRLYIPDYTLVQDGFLMFDYPDLEHECEVNGGFSVERTANEFERLLVSFLEQVAKDILGDFIPVYPTCKVIDNASAVHNGTANCIRNAEKQYNNMGMKVRYDLLYISIKTELFRREKFNEVFATYTHELCHMFGYDKSDAFSYALTRAMAILVNNANKLEKYMQEWDSFFEL